jgi:hypothetical protein
MKQIRLIILLIHYCFDVYVIKTLEPDYFTNSSFSYTEDGIVYPVNVKAFVKYMRPLCIYLSSFNLSSFYTQMYWKICQEHCHIQQNYHKYCL